jgi:hypothetical protein
LARLRATVVERRSTLIGDKTMVLAAWTMLKETVLAFVNDGALSRGAAIAFYTVTQLRQSF